MQRLVVFHPHELTSCPFSKRDANGSHNCDWCGNSTRDPVSSSSSPSKGLSPPSSSSSSSTASNYYYTCESCYTTYCRNCVEGTPLKSYTIANHPHPLSFSIVGDNWTCNTASSHTSELRPSDRVRFRCSACDFDMCDECLQRNSTQSLLSFAHPEHRLMPCTWSGTRSKWSCKAAGDNLLGKCASGCNREGQWPSIVCWRCERCDFNLCEADAKKLEMDCPQPMTTTQSTILNTPPPPTETRVPPPRKLSAGSANTDKAPCYKLAALGTSSTGPSPSPVLPPPAPLPPTARGEELFNYSPPVGGMKRKVTNAMMVTELKKRGFIRSSAVEVAFSAVDRALFLPANHPCPYLGGPHRNASPSWNMAEVACYAEMLETLLGGSRREDNNKNAHVRSFLVIGPCSGYVNAIASWIMGPGSYSVGLDLRKSVTDHATHCVDEWRRSLPKFATSRAGNIYFQEGDLLSGASRGRVFDRILCDVSIKAIRREETLEAIIKLLPVGGMATMVLPKDKPVLLEKNSEFGGKYRDLNPGPRGTTWSMISSDVCVVDDAASSVASVIAPPPALHPRAVGGCAEQFKSLEVFLSEIGLEKYFVTFEKEEITLDQMASFTESDFAEIGLPKGPRKVILNTIEYQKRTEFEAVKMRKSDSAIPHSAPSSDCNITTTTTTTTPSSTASRWMNSSCPSGFGMEAVVATTSLLPNVTRGSKIGEGSFGSVWSGNLGLSQVAMKALHHHHHHHDDDEDEEDSNTHLSCDDVDARFMEECTLLSKLRHPNILTYYGLCKCHGEFYMVMEKAKGSVLSLLRSPIGPDLGQETLVGMALSCAAGMDFLSDAKIIHNDLAARNLLFFPEGDRYTVKVADFGLARTLTEAEQERQDLQRICTTKLPPCPIKWTAPEGLKERLFTTKSDVWSYGVVLWELFSTGEDPYSDIELKDVLPRLEKGYRLPQPPHCPEIVYQEMLHCWHEHPQQRPSWRKLWETLAPLSGDQLTNDATSSVTDKEQGGYFVMPSIPGSKGGQSSSSTTTTNVANEPQMIIDLCDYPTPQ